ncbi:subtilase family-domain-containing protein [Gaertneriomyces semiglobifer]|nr:subtilase family-domain-containing protein [Gaertneriomyces semiglobifer]
MVLSSVRPFPAQGLLPKEETQAASFVRANPEFDGRGTVIAIMDTGVDPGAPGMQVTTDGKPKIIDIIDCTGSGDVLCTTVVEATVTEEDGVTKRTLPGLSGRTLHIGDWKNPTGKYRLGLKKSADLFPKTLSDRLQQERKKKFEIQHHALLTNAERELQALESAKEGDADERETKEANLKACIDTLKDQWKSYNDPGFLIDCIVFHDGEKFRAVVDMEESGQLADNQLLTNYCDEFQYVRFSNESMLNFSVNIYDEGEILSIVTLAGTHGTHVAGIAAANYPDDPTINGVAPGAQIISLKLGDNRLGSMETGTGLVRSAIELARLKPDLANLSYGEAASSSETGRFIEILRDEVINKAGCIFVTSAGNAGPALTTIGAPAGSTNAVISVGAYVTKQMQEAEYAMLDTVTEGPYTWSSRGPAHDGAAGVDIYAPGAAITSVPQYSNQFSQLMNGTSMSSPNCCGCLSLLVSGLKASKIPYTPYSVKAAIRNTGLKIDDPFGTGFIQVEKAWEHLSAKWDGAINPFQLQYNIKVQNNGRGIYLRDICETNEVRQVQVDVNPHFFNSEHPSVNALRGELELRVALHGTERWIKCPDFALLGAAGRTFNITVDPTMLPPGLHFAEILGMDTRNGKGGPIFRIPVTVSKPESAARGTLEETASYLKWDKLRFNPGTIQRRFIAVPLGANFAELTVRSVDRNAPAQFYAHLMQLQQETRYVQFEHSYRFSLSRLNVTSLGSEAEQAVYTKLFPVQSYTTLEVCLAQFWSSLDPSVVDVELKFHGIQCSFSNNHNSGYGAATGTGGDLVYLNSGNNGFTRVDVCSGIRREEITASATLDTFRRFIRPTDSEVSPLKSRDVLPDSRQVHQLVLTYSLKVSDAANGMNITPSVPRVSNVLYDSCLESFVLVVYDNNKQELSYQDVFPKAVKLSNGTYTVRVQVASASLELLDKMTALPLVVDQALEKSSSLTAYKTLRDAITENKGATFKKRTLERGGKAVFFLGGDGVNLPKDAKQGDLLLGKLNVLGGEGKLDGSLYNIAWLVPPSVPEKDKESTGAKDEEKDDATLLKEAVRDVEIQHIKKMKNEDERAKLIQKLEAEWKDHLPLWSTRLEVVGEKAAKEEKETSIVSDNVIGEITNLVTKILDLADEREVAIWFGVRHDSANMTSKERKAIAQKTKEMEKRKEGIVLAYTWKAWTVKQQVLKNEVSIDALTASLQTLASWLPEPATNNAKYLLLWAWSQMKRNLHGNALKVVNKWLADATKAGDSKWGEISKLQTDIMSELGWGVWQEYESKWGLIKNPSAYTVF